MFHSGPITNQNGHRDSRIDMTLDLSQIGVIGISPVEFQFFDSLFGEKQIPVVTHLF